MFLQVVQVVQRHSSGNVEKNDDLVAYSFSNTSAKNYQNQLMVCILAVL